MGLIVFYHERIVSISNLIIIIIMIIIYIKYSINEK